MPSWIVLAAASRARCGSANSTLSAARSSSSCSGVRAPTIGGVSRHPGESGLGRSAADFPGDAGQNLGDAGIAFGDRAEGEVEALAGALAGGGPGRGQVGSGVLAGQDAAGQRRAGDHAEAHLAADRGRIAFAGALDEVVLGLQRGLRRPSAQVGDGLHARDLPGRGAGHRDVVDFALPGEAVHPARDLLDRRREIPDAQVEIVRVQRPAGWRPPRRTAFRGAARRSSGRRDGAGSCISTRGQGFRGGAGDLAEQALGGAVGAGRRGVREVAAADDSRTALNRLFAR